MTKTPWYSSKVHPVRMGVYERDLRKFPMPGKIRYCYWNGAEWGGWAEDIRSAETNGTTGFRSSIQYARWRGLLKKSQ